MRLIIFILSFIFSISLHAGDGYYKPTYSGGWIKNCNLVGNNGDVNTGLRFQSESAAHSCYVDFFSARFPESSYPSFHPMVYSHHVDNNNGTFDEYVEAGGAGDISGRTIFVPDTCPSGQWESANGVCSPSPTECTWPEVSDGEQCVPVECPDGYYVGDSQCEVIPASNYCSSGDYRTDTYTFTKNTYPTINFESPYCISGCIVNPQIEYSIASSGTNCGTDTNGNYTCTSGSTTWNVKVKSTVQSDSYERQCEPDSPSPTCTDCTASPDNGQPVENNTTNNNTTNTTSSTTNPDGSTTETSTTTHDDGSTSTTTTDTDPDGNSTSSTNNTDGKASTSQQATSGDISQLSNQLSAGFGGMYEHQNNTNQKLDGITTGIDNLADIAGASKTNLDDIKNSLTGSETFDADTALEDPTANHEGFESTVSDIGEATAWTHSGDDFESAITAYVPDHSTCQTITMNGKDGPFDFPSASGCQKLETFKTIMAWMLNFLLLYALFHMAFEESARPA